MKNQNELSAETSPYLLQHAQNPVHWKAWNTTSLAQAKEQNKLLIISIGYSACHWCHVMEHETFEQEDAASVMNTNFINIKVDREERPDVDAVYMKSVQIMTGRGGWPMNVVCLPDGRPVWGGTYFKKENWIETLEQLAAMYAEAPEKIEDYAERLHLGMQENLLIPEKENSNLPETFFQDALALWSKSFDLEFGGYSRAPKFMMPNNYRFLLRYAYETQDRKLMDFVHLTLTKMAWGGIFDTVDGGFSRYAVDFKWHIPHFEKMLYDNGQLVSLYADAYKQTKDPLYKTVIEKTLAFIEREWLTTEGSFYSALDADSLNSEKHLEEGAFYVWDIATLKRVVQNDFALFSTLYNINSFGHWEEDHYVLIQNDSLENISASFGITLSDLILKKQEFEKILYQEREKRNKPRLDDKCLTSWNALMLKGYIDAYKALGDIHYLEIIHKNADFLLTKIWSADGHLYHTYKNNTASINGYLEDYCFVIDAFIGLYEITLEEQWLGYSKQLTDYCFDHFYDAEKSFFRFTSDIDKALIIPNYEIEDNVIPASNSVMSENLYRLSIYFDNSFYLDTVTKMIAVLSPNIAYPSAYSNWLYVMLYTSKSSTELVVSGSTAQEEIKKINREYLPNVIIAGMTKESEIPLSQNRFIKDRLQFFVCQNNSCNLPVSSSEEALNELKIN